MRMEDIPGPAVRGRFVPGAEDAREGDLVRVLRRVANDVGRYCAPPDYGSLGCREPPPRSRRVRIPPLRGATRPSAWCRPTPKRRPPMRRPAPAVAVPSAANPSLPPGFVVAIGCSCVANNLRGFSAVSLKRVLLGPSRRPCAARARGPRVFTRASGSEPCWPGQATTIAQGFLGARSWPIGVSRLALRSASAGSPGPQSNPGTGRAAPHVGCRLPGAGLWGWLRVG